MQELLRHADVRTTMIYTHVRNRGGQGVLSPCIRGMRIRVSDVLELLASGMTPKQILKEHPDLEPEDIQACLRFVGHPVVAA